MSLPALLWPKITIMKVDGTEDYFVHDAFSPASGARIIAAEVEDCELVANPFRIVIEDSDGSLDQGVGNGNRLRIPIGTTQQNLTDFVTCYVCFVEVSRADTNVKKITLHGYSSLAPT